MAARMNEIYRKGQAHLGAKHSTRCGGQAWRKTCKQSSFCVGVVWQTETEHIVQHLVQTKKSQKEAALIQGSSLIINFVYMPKKEVTAFFQPTKAI